MQKLTAVTTESEMEEDKNESQLAQFGKTGLSAPRHQFHQKIQFQHPRSPGVCPCGEMNRRMVVWCKAG